MKEAASTFEASNFQWPLVIRTNILKYSRRVWFWILIDIGSYRDEHSLHMFTRSSLITSHFTCPLSNPQETARQKRFDSCFPPLLWGGFLEPWICYRTMAVQGVAGLWSDECEVLHTLDTSGLVNTTSMNHDMLRIRPCLVGSANSSHTHKHT